MGENIETTGIKPGQVTSGKVTEAYAIEQLCSVVDNEVVPGVRSVCREQHRHRDILEGTNDKGGLITEVAKNKTRSKINLSLILGFVVVVAIALIGLVVRIAS